MARFIYCCLILLVLGLPAQAKAQEAVVYNLKQAVTRALEANPNMEAKQLAVDRSKMDVGVAQSYFWPTLTWSKNRNKLHNTGDVGTSEDYSNTSYGSGFRGALSLFAGFSHVANLQKAMLSVNVEEARQSLARLELIGNVQLQFLQLLKSREDMKTVQDSKKRIVTQLKAAQAFVKVGMAPYLNVLQNEVELSKVNQQEIRAANMIRNAEVMLNRYLGYTEKDKVSYQGDLKDFNGMLEYDEEEAIKTSLRYRPDLIIAQKSVAVALKQSQITAGRFLPQVSLNYDTTDYSKYYPDPNVNIYTGAKTSRDYSREYWNIGLNFSWELFSGGGTTFAFLGDRKAAASMRKSYEDTMAAARADVIRALLDIQAARELIATSRKGVEAATESYAMANKRYMTNIGTITELLDAQSRLTEAEAGYSQALTEYQASRSRFFYNIGKENIGLE